MAQRDTKAELVSFLEKHAFEPVLRAKEDPVPTAKRDDLVDLQQRTRAQD
jgi:hypothetical protein